MRELTLSETLDINGGRYFGIDNLSMILEPVSTIGNLNIDTSEPIIIRPVEPIIIKPVEPIQYEEI